MFATTREILKAHQRYEHFKLVVYGPEGHGKSSFCIQLLAELYGKKEMVALTDANGNPLLDAKGNPIMSYECVEPDWYAWRDHMVWMPEEFEKKINEARISGKQQLALVWNDAGTWAHKNRRFSDWAMRLAESSQMWRRWYAGIILNAPDPNELLRFLRGYSWHLGRINKAGGNKRFIRIYKNDIAPDMQKRITRIVIHEDWFDVRIPDQVFNDFNKVDRMYAAILHKRQMKAREEEFDTEEIQEIMSELGPTND